MIEEFKGAVEKSRQHGRYQPVDQPAEGRYECTHEKAAG